MKYIKLQIQEAQRMPAIKKKNHKKGSPGHIILKLLENQRNKENLEGIQRKRAHYIERKKKKEFR